MQFSIRDLLWATVVVAMGLGWWASYRAVEAKRLAAVGQAHRLHVAMGSARTSHAQQANEISRLCQSLAEQFVESGCLRYPRYNSHERALVDWSVLNEQLVAP
jgi:hypothetical protein